MTYHATTSSPTMYFHPAVLYLLKHDGSSCLGSNGGLNNFMEILEEWTLL